MSVPKPFFVVPMGGAKVGGGWIIVDRQTFAYLRVRIRKVTEEPVEDGFDGLDRGPGDLCVTKVVLGGLDGRILEIMDELVAKCLDLSSGFIAMDASEGVQTDLRGALKPEQPADDPLVIVTHRHVIPSTLRRNGSVWPDDIPSFRGRTTVAPFARRVGGSA